MKHLLHKLSSLRLLTLLAVLLGLGSSAAWADDYELYSGTITEGDYIIYYSGKAMKNTISSSRLTYEEVTPANGIITTTDAAIIWHIAASGTYWTIYNASVNKYAAGTGAKNKAQMLADGTDDKALWTVSGTSTYEFVNKANAAASVNKNLRNNGTYGFACYSTDTGGALSLYKKKAAAKTDPTITFNNGSVRVGRTLNLSTLFSSNSEGAVTFSITAGSSYASIDGSTLTGVAEGSVTVKAAQAAAGNYNAGEASATITVNAALALSSIAITTAPTKTTYTEGETFDPAGMVVTATYSNSSTDDVTASCTFSPSTSTALTTSNTEITVSYTENAVEKTTTQAITVNALPKYTVSFDAGNGTYTGGDKTETEYQGGVTLPSATSTKSGWEFIGWATSEISNTTIRPTLFAAGSTYYPTANITLYAVYALEDAINKYAMATSNSDIVDGANVVISSLGNNKYTLANNNGTLTGISNFTPTNGVITCANTQAIWTLAISNGNVTIANGRKYLKRSSTTVSVDNNSYNWTINESNLVDDRFLVKDASYNYYLEHGGSSWTVYNTNSPTQNATNNYLGLTIYVEKANKYDSNPSALITPTVAFDSTDPVTLYLDGTTTNTNTATVTGVSKTINYTSSDTDVATVTSSGVVTAEGIGTATITASVDAELGVSTSASDTYTVTVKSTTTLAGIKALATSSTAVNFTADLASDLVITYVNGSHAYLQSGDVAVYASCATGDWEAGKKFTGAISGKVKKLNNEYQITAIDQTPVAGGVVPDAIEVAITNLTTANYATYEGRKIAINGATISTAMTSSQNTGGQITTDGTNKLNIYARETGIALTKDEKGNFVGYIGRYNDGIRYYMYEQSQFTKTHNAPTAQTLTFASYAVELDEDTDDVEDFTGQVVSGAKGTVTYSIDSDASSVVTSINSETGAVVLSGNRGTATIKASAAAKEVTEAGVTTPYTATTKTYTITVYPRYTVTFSVNDAETELRQTTHGAPIAVPSPSDNSGFKFVGWSTSTVSLTNVAPSMETLGATITPENDDTYYYAVFASATVTPDVEYTSTFTIKQSSTPSSPYVNNGSSWTWSNVTFQNDNNACIDKTSGSITFTLPAGGKAVSLNITKTGNAWAGAAAVVLKDASSNTVNTYTGSSVSFDFTEGTYDESSSYTLTNTTGSNAWVDHITFVYTADGVSYKNYCTTVPAHVNIASTAGYTTYVATDNVSFPVGATAYIATAVNPSTIHLDEVVAVPEGTAVVVKGDKGVYLLDVEDAGDCDDVSGNLLEASNGSVEGDGSTIFALGVGKVAPYAGQVGFYLVKEEVAVPAGKAYLTIPASVKEFLTFVFDDLPTTVSEVKNEGVNSEKSIFNLAGQKMSKLQKGVNIVNGKKVLVK